jgi:hypothetical protein
VDTNILRKDSPKVAPQPRRHPTAAMRGWVYIGFEGEDEQCEHVELVERVPCRRCRDTRESL